MSRISAVMIVIARELRRIYHSSHCHLRSFILRAHNQIYSKSRPNLLVPVNEKYQMAVDYRSYRIIRKSQKYDDDVALELQEKLEKGANQMKD